MSAVEDPFTIDIQNATISTTLNASMVSSVLMGIYTIVYVGTLYFHLTKNTVNINRRIILSTVSVLYLLCLLQFSFQWYLINWSVVTNGDTRESIFFAALQGGPQWMLVIDECLFYAPLIVSDGLLIWRCYNVWGQSLRIISPLLVLFITELGLCIATVALEGSQNQLTSDATVIITNRMISASIMTSLSTTIISTSLIWYRIYSVSCLNGPTSRSIFSHIVILVVESAALYSLVLLLNAITTVVPSFTVIGSLGDQANYYLEVLLVVTAGMSPTVLVARIALTTQATGTVEYADTRISGLRFEAQQRSTTGREIKTPSAHD